MGDAEKILSEGGMNFEFSKGSTVGYKARKVDRVGKAGQIATGEGTVYGFESGRYLIQVGDRITPVKQENVYKLDSQPPQSVVGQIEETRTTLQAPLSEEDRQN